jgi:hypothetical protein
VRTTLRAVVLSAMLVILVPEHAAAQAKPDDALLRRIEILERRANELERRFRELESPRPTEQPRTTPAAACGNARVLANWRRLRRGMKEDDVRSLLGEPQRVNGGDLAIWYWGDASVTFLDDKVYQWQEPDR